MDNNHEIEDLKLVRREPWNKGKLIGAKPPLRPSHVWSIRTKLQMADRKRDLALFNLAIDSKLRGCDVVALRVDDVAPSGYAMDRATIRQSPGGTSAVQFEPEHMATVSATYRVWAGTALTADYQFVTGSAAISRDELSTLELDPYHLLNLGITQDVAGGAAQLFGRIENVLDEDYETAYGFPEAGRVFYLGMRTKL